MKKKTIEELENDFWKSPDFFPTKLVERVYALRKKKIINLDFEDMRLLASQNVGLDYIIPIIIDKLNSDPLFEAFSFPGDLLSTVIDVDENYWKNHSSELESFISILEKVKIEMGNLEEPDEVDNEISSLIEIFLENKGKVID